MSNLIPHRHQPDLFTADLAAAPLKEMSEHLEFPFFGLARQPYHGVRHYEDARGNYIELRPGIEGLPTILDQDLLIYCVSKALAEVRRGNPLPERIQMTAADLLRFTNRPTGGRQYDAVEAAIYRLTELTLVTNLRGEDAVYTELFGVVDRASMVRRNNRRSRSGSLLGCSITFSSWMCEALEARRILTLHEDYFRLGTPLERAVYQVVRKHCGEQPKWRIGTAKLQAKVGSTSALRKFRFALKALVQRWENTELLGYRLQYEDKADLLTVRYAPAPSRIRADTQLWEGRINEQTAAALRDRHPDLDPGQMEQIWRSWAASRPEPPRNANAAFLGFCDRYKELRQQADSEDRDAPRPLIGDPPHAAAMNWWIGLSLEKQQAAAKEFQICGVGYDWAFMRTEKQIIEKAAQMWVGIERPREEM